MDELTPGLVRIEPGLPKAVPPVEMGRKLVSVDGVLIVVWLAGAGVVPLVNEAVCED
jgi:hypothetical protein